MIEDNGILVTNFVLGQCHLLQFWLGILVGNNGDFGHKFGLETMPLVTNFDFHFPRMTLDDLNGCQPLSSRWLKRRSVEIIV